MADKRNLVDEIVSALEKHTRGVQIGIYTIAGIGLAVAVHKVRPVSKFSRALDIPEHFIRQKEILKGKVVGVEPSFAGPRLLVSHQPPIHIPIWHSSKPPLPVQIWGVKLIGGNGISWMQCVAVGQEATFTPLARGSDAVLANVTLHLPIIEPLSMVKDTKKSKQKKQPQTEVIEVGERLVELGLGVVTDEAALPPPQKKWWLRLLSEKTSGEILQRAQSRAVAKRAGHWQEMYPRSRISLMTAYVKNQLPSFGSRKKVSQASIVA